MIVRLKRSFDAGVEKVRWFSSLISERLKVEVAIVKLLWESNDLEKNRAALKRSIGERVFELRGRQDVNLLKDTKIRQALAELERLETELKDIESKVSEIGKVEE